MSDHLPECPRSGCPACYAAGLDAAREAVAALPSWEGMAWDKCRAESLAAIDALRGES